MDGTRMEHGQGRGRRWGSAGASPYRVLRTVTIRIESGIREGERPRETLTSLGAPRNRNDGDRPRKLSGYPSLFVIRVIRVIRGSCFCSLRGKIFNHG